MPKLSNIKISPNPSRGKGIRPWHDFNVVKPSSKQEGIKREQSVSRTVSKVLAKREQGVSKVLAKREQSVSKALAEPLAEPLAEREQSVSKALAMNNKTITDDTIETLVGNERGLLKFLFQKCQSIGSLESPAITTDELKNILKINAVHLRNLLYRLSNKGIIKTSKLKNGKSGWRKFILSKEIFQRLSLDQSVSKALAEREQSVSKALAKPLAEPLATSLSSSSSDYIIKETTTGDTKNITETQITQKWQELDIEPLSQIGFTKTHLVQIISQDKLSGDMVQNSIYAFAFDLQENNKAKDIKGDPINYFMGILRNGKPYAPPSNYESPQSQAVRLYTERMKEIEQKRISIEKEAMRLAFSDWFVQLNDTQKKDFLPANMRHNVKLEKNKMVESLAKAYFESEVWVNKKREIITTEIKTREVTDGKNITSK